MANAPGRSWARHTITVCTTCRLEGQARAPGEALIIKLRERVTRADGCGPPESFSVSDVDCMAGCSTPCTVAFQADGKATYLFGDIDPAEDIDALIAFAGQYERSDDGWTRSAERPPGLAGKTLARVPAMIPVGATRADT